MCHCELIVAIDGPANTNTKDYGRQCNGAGYNE